MNDRPVRTGQTVWQDKISESTEITSSGKVLRPAVESEEILRTDWTLFLILRN